MKKIFTLLMMSLMLFSCASKRYTKKAAKFEEAGLYKDAAAYYYEAVKKKDSNVEAKLGLRKNGQMVLEDKLSDFTEAYKKGDYEKAVYNFLEAEKYYEKVNGVNVELSLPEYHREYYQEAKGDFLRKKYTDGLEKLDREEFTAAEEVFGEIKSIDPEYKDVQAKYNVAKYEPMYRMGNEHLNNALYRKAYYTFDEIEKGAGNYRQTLPLKGEALEKATISIAIPNFAASYRYNAEVSNELTTQLKGELSNMDNPFIKVVEGGTAMPNTYNLQASSLDLPALRLAGVKAVLLGEIVSTERKTGDVYVETKRGFVKNVTKYKDKEGKEQEKVTYDKTTYKEYKQKSHAKLNIQYKLISTENGEVLLSDSRHLSDKDEVHYAKYKGDTKKLVPGYWKYKNRNTSEDVIKDKNSEIDNLRDLLKAKQSPTESKKLLEGLIDEATEDIVKKVDTYDPES